MNNTCKVAMVTGAGSGIGRASALALLRAGYRVALVGRREEELRKTAEMAGEQGIHTLSVSADITNEHSVARLFTAVKEAYGRLDVLFNNAGMALPDVPTEDLLLADWEKLMRVNVTGSFLCAREALRLMKNQSPKGGRIINNGSVSAHVPRVNAAAYTVSKHAITGLTRSICLDYRDESICCSQIDIGNAAVGVMEAMHQGGSKQADGSSRPEARIDVSTVADTVVYLANLPLEANVPFMTLMANAMPYMGRG